MGKPVLALICLALLHSGVSLRAESPDTPPSPPAHEGTANDFIPLPDDENDDCTLDKLTNGCVLFSPDGPEAIPVTDDTVIPNLSALTKPLPEKAVVQLKKNFEKALKQASMAQQDQLNDIRVAASHVLASVTDDDGPDEHFNRYLADHIDDKIATVFLPPQENELRGVPLPWPPDHPRGVTSVPVDEARAYLDDLFSDDPGALDKMRELVADSHDVVDTFSKIMNEGVSVPPSPTESALARVSPEQRARVEELVGFTRKAIVRALLGGRKPAELSQEELAAIRKIETIKLSLTPPERMKDDPNCLGLPNAFYQPLSHTLSLCPGIYHLPESAIVGIVGHELGHAIDPCSSQFAAYSIDRARLAAVEKALPSTAPKNRGQRRLAHILDQDPNDFTALHSELDGVPKADLANFEKAGVLKQRAPAIPSRRYILSDVYHCLSLSAGGEFPAFNAAKAEHTAERVAAFRCEQTPWLNFDTEKKRLFDLLQRYPDCDITTFHKPIDEATADWLGASAEGMFVAQKDYKLPGAGTPAGKLSPVAFFASLACRERERISPRQEQNDAEALDYLHQDLEISRDDHASSARRLAYIFLTNPDIRKAMGCQPTQHPFCEHEAPSGHGRAPANPLEKQP